jgi:hypothetical protein
MLHPVLQLIATKPQLLVEHVGAYAELVGVEVGKTTTLWKSRARLYAAALFLLIVGILFAGVALMLWALIPSTGMNLPWLLPAVPLVPLVAGGFCALRARRKPTYPAFGILKTQLDADLAMLREVSSV